VAAEVAHDAALMLGLDPLRDERQPERVAEVHDPLQQHEVVARPVDRSSEAAVDLHDVDRQPTEIGERRVTGSEVVEREHDPHRLERMQLLLDPVTRREQHAFGELERQALRREARRRERRFDVVEELGMLELPRRHVD
jgi:hypothetical protein